MSAVDDLLALGLPLPELSDYQTIPDSANGWPLWVRRATADAALERLAQIVLGHKERIAHEAEKRKQLRELLDGTARWLAHEGWYTADGTYMVDPAAVRADLVVRHEEEP